MQSARSVRELYRELDIVEAAVAEAVMRFNGGNGRTSAGILKELNLTPGLKVPDGRPKRTGAGQLNRLASGQQLNMSSEL